MITLNIETRGLTATATAFHRAGRRIPMTVPLTRARDEVLVPGVREAFLTEGRSIGEDWPDLSPDTQRIRKAGGFGANSPKLIRRGNLFKAATAKSRWQLSASQGMVYYNFGNFPKSAQRGAAYAGYHMTGTQFMPARPFVAITDNQADEIQSIFAGFATQHLILGALASRTRGAGLVGLR